MTLIWSAIKLTTTLLRTLGRIYIDIASEIDDALADYRVELPAEFLEELSE